MADLESILKKLNKDKKESDLIGVIADKELVRTTTSTGSPYIDFKLGGGFINGGYNTIIADGGTGKSSIALLACKSATDKGLYAVYFDGEGTLTDSYIDRMGVDRNRLVVKRGRNLEAMLDTAELFSTADDVGVIIMDSIHIYTSSSVEEKSASDSTMAIEARKYNQRMPIIEGNCMNRGIALIGLTSYRLTPGAMGDPRKLPRGEWQYTMSNTILELTRKDLIVNSDKEPIGHKIDVRIKKTKSNFFNAKDAFSVDFFYEGGFNQNSEYAKLFVEKGIIRQGGAWYSFPDLNGEEVKLQGLDSVIKYLTDNQDLFNHLKEYL